MSEDFLSSFEEFYEEFYSGAGGEVDECMLMLRFFGDALEPTEITKLLGVPPKIAYRKGDPRSDKPSVLQTTGLWLLECERTNDTADNQIRLLLTEDLPQDLSLWAALSQRFSAAIKIHLYLARWCRETILSADTIALLGERGLKLNIDIYSRRPRVS
jgi:hypothetical protein